MWANKRRKETEKSTHTHATDEAKTKRNEDIVVYKFTIKPFIDADMPQSPAAVACFFSE